MFISRFEAAAQRFPDAIALVAGYRKLSYRELDQQAEQVCAVLKRRGVCANALVAIIAERSYRCIVVILGVLKAGAVYLPIDEECPPSRTAFILEDSQPAVVVCEASYLTGSACSQSTVITIDELFRLAGNEPPSSEPPRAVNGFEAPAYVLYTSGSTGKPKGVVVSNGNLASYLDAVNGELELSTHSVFLATTTLSFDISITEIHLPLSVGATVVLAPSYAMRQPAHLEMLVESLRVTHLQATPSAWEGLTHGKPNVFLGVQCLVGGEVLPPRLASRLLELSGSPLLHLYGPTETTVWACAYWMTEPTDIAIPLGRPLRNAVVSIRNDDLQPLGEGAVGEICIAGDCVSMGYLNRPELTASRFVSIDEESGQPQRLYRTGDSGKLSDGNFHFLGRKDDQIKLNGHRIELGEVDRALRSLKGVDAAVAVVVSSNGSSALKGFIVAERSPEGAALSAKSVRHQLCQLLPSSMVPSAIETIDHIPVSPNGKIDRDALARRGFNPAAQEGEPPLVGMHAALVEIFREVLALERVPIDASFFDLGGSSFRAIQLLLEVEKRWNVQLSIESLFSASTVRQIAALIEQPVRNGDHFDHVLPLRTTGALPPLWCIHPGSGISWPYSALSRFIDSERPVFALQSPSLSRPLSPFRTLSDMCAHYAGTIARMDPQRSVHLLGWSFGAQIARDVAHALTAKNIPVLSLTLLDDVPLSEPAARPQFSAGVILELRANVKSFLAKDLGKMEESQSFDNETVERVVSTYLENVRLAAQTNYPTFNAPTLTIYPNGSHELAHRPGSEIAIFKSTKAGHLDLVSEESAPDICRDVNFHLRQVEFT